MIDFDAFAEDVLSTDAFGQEAVWIPAGGQGKTVKAVFENSFVAIEGIGDAGISSSMPSVTCKTLDVEGAARGDVLRIDDTDYNVVEARPDGAGFTVLILSKD